MGQGCPWVWIPFIWDPAGVVLTNTCSKEKAVSHCGGWSHRTVSSCRLGGSSWERPRFQAPDGPRAVSSAHTAPDVFLSSPGDTDPVASPLPGVKPEVVQGSWGMELALPGEHSHPCQGAVVPRSCRAAWARDEPDHPLPQPADWATYCNRSLSHILKSSASDKPVCCPGSRGALSEDRSGAPMAHSWPEVAGPGHLPCRAPRGPTSCCWGSGGDPSPIFRITSCRVGSQNWKSWTEGVS